MTAVTCPACGTVSHFDDMRRDAQEFCRKCDYPLFWARSTGVGPATDDAGGEGLRRLPGAGGRTALASIACRLCAEPNVVTAVVCIRCGGDLRLPRPASDLEPEEPAVTEEVRVPVETPPVPAWWPELLAMTALPLLVVLWMLAVLE